MARLPGVPSPPGMDETGAVPELDSRLGRIGALGRLVVRPVGAVVVDSPAWALAVRSVGIEPIRSSSEALTDERSSLR
jgi:hypothetical protein